MLPEQKKRSGRYHLCRADFYRALARKEHEAKSNHRMFCTKIHLGFLLGLLLAISADAEVRVFVQDTNGIAVIKYECTAGEVVRAFALDVSVDRGTIVYISGFFRGPSKAGATGYGVFPASLRYHLQLNSTNMDWSAPDYTPLADPGDYPTDTLPGLGSKGVTLEFGGLWEPTLFSAIPSAAGTLCSLKLSRPANVSVKANDCRGGVVSAISGMAIHTTFAGSPIGFPQKKRRPPKRRSDHPV